MAKKTVTSKKRNVKVDALGQLHVHSSFNNIIVSLANSEGQVISWSSAGKMGFRGSKKNTPYAAQMAAEDCAKVAFDLGLRKVRAMAVSLPSVPSTVQVSRLSRLSMSLRCRTMVAVPRSVVASNFHLLSSCLGDRREEQQKQKNYIFILWQDI